jgi:hypothetical protein
MVKPRILICYSNPIDTARLRLDIEHSEIESVLSKSGLDTGLIKRLHATTLETLLDELSEGSFEIIEFSGHGNNKGIYLENDARTSSQLITTDVLLHILKIASPTLRALLLTCCYSENYKLKISNYVPYLISVDGPAPDKAAIQFSKRFFSTYLAPPYSVERAFFFAGIYGRKDNFSVKLTRRGLLRQKGKLKIEAVVGLHNKIVLDLTQIRKKIDNIDFSKDKFLELICTSLKAHFSLFKKPLERVAIPFGNFIGLFTWQNEIDPIICEQFFSVSSNLSEASFNSIALLMSRYTSLARAQYRFKTEPIYQGQAEILRRSLDEFHEAAQTYFTGEHSTVLRALAPDTYKITGGILKASLTEADISWSHEEYGYTVVQLETALTSIHNLLIPAIKRS